MQDYYEKSMRALQLAGMSKRTRGFSGLFRAFQGRP